MESIYQARDIEINTQRFWQEKNSFQAVEDFNKEKFYCLAMFPYPSGNLHMGHVRNYTIADVIARYQMMLDKNVLQPMGWDAFGLPAENAAIKHGVAPAQWTYNNIQHMRTQLQQLGFAYDWSREITTCDPNYYRWEQWLFLRLYKKGLAYKKLSEVNWDPVDQTVLANEQVVNGRGWRSGALIERLEISQWFLKISTYADELLEDIDKLTHWPEQVKIMQRNWIGKSTGAEISFKLADQPNETLTIFTTRVDTLYGVTYLALAPQHPLVKQLAQTNSSLNEFIETCKNIKMAEAELATMEKLGMPLNINVIHPLSKQLIPVWTANFVLMDYGHGALMAVPGHDTRDHEFALKYQLPIKQVIAPINDQPWDIQQSAYTELGTLINSEQFNHLDSATAQTKILAELTRLQCGMEKTQYRLRDWGISRQRYWGTPIPIINCPECGAVPVPEKDLPVILPEEVNFDGMHSPLKSMKEFLETTCPECQQKAFRETDTFDTFVESSWYYARFACKKLSNSMLDGRSNYWLPVDQYVGGIEHAVMHLLYARFFHKILRDEGLVNSDEPFVRLLTQGMVLNNGTKMSKSKGNVVDPQPLIEQYGADTVRLFTIFAAPPEQSLEWSDSGVEGAYRFLKRLWAYAFEHHHLIRSQNHLPKTNLLAACNWEQADLEQTEVLRQIYSVLDQVKADYERQQFNTVVSGCMKILNLLTKIPEASSDKIDVKAIVIQRGMAHLLRILSPITPHITHQLWKELHFADTILEASWPKPCPAFFKRASIELIIQINGKLRSRIKVDANADQESIESSIKNDEKIQQLLAGKNINRMILVPGKLVNIVISE